MSKVTTVEFVLNLVKQSLANNQTINYEELVKIILRSQQYDITSAQYNQVKIESMVMLNETVDFDIKKFDEAGDIQYKKMQESQKAWQPAMKQLRKELRISAKLRAQKRALAAMANS